MLQCIALPVNVQNIFSDKENSATLQIGSRFQMTSMKIKLYHNLEEMQHKKAGVKRRLALSPESYVGFLLWGFVRMQVL